MRSRLIIAHFHKFNALWLLFRYACYQNKKRIGLLTNAFVVGFLLFVKKILLFLTKSLLNFLIVIMV